MKRPASGGSKRSIHSAAKPAPTRASYSVRSSSRSSSSTAILSEPTRRKESPASDSIRVDRVLGPRHQLSGVGLADRLGRDIERRRHAAEGEASVTPARALGDPAAVVETHALARLGEPERCCTTGDAAADDDHLRVVDVVLRERRGGLAEPVGRHRRGSYGSGDHQTPGRTRIDGSRTMPPLTMTHTAQPERGIPREAVAAAGVAAALAAALAWLGPPGSDFAAHLYQSGVFEDHGFGIWNNFWYAGRYSFVTYSLLYYPLAALFGIRLLAVASIATAALAFGVIASREWGPASRWSNRSFAVVWAGIVLSGAFPFALGAALALLALWALQAGRRGRFALLTVLALAASPVAFVLLGVILAGIGLSRAPRRTELALPLTTLALATAVELVLLRLFPAGGRFPFSLPEFARGMRLLRARDPAHLARGDRRGVALDLRRLPDRVHDGLPRTVEPRREHRTPALRGDPDRDSHALVATLAAAADCALRALTRRCLEPDPARGELCEDERRPGRQRRLLGADRAVPPYAPLAVVPGGGGRHRWSLARRLPPRRGHSDRPRLVPAGRLPPERRPLHQARSRPLPRVAPLSRRAVRRPAGCPARLQRRGGGRADRGGPVGPRRGVPVSAHDGVRRSFPATDRHRPGPGESCSPLDGTGSPSILRGRAATASPRTGPRTGPRAQVASRVVPTEPSG